MPADDVGDIADRHPLVGDAANAGLQERELIKLATLASTTTDALRRRGVPEPAASLTAQAGIAVFKVSFERWIDDAQDRDLSQLMRESLDELKAVTARE